MGQGGWFADEAAEYRADLVWFQLQPVPGVVWFPVLLLNQRLLAMGLLSHHGDDVAAEVVYDLKQLVPERAGAEAGHDGESRQISAIVRPTARHGVFFMDDAVFGGFL
jgi:hypothetical protein